MDRFLERAKTRDPAMEQNLDDLYFADSKSNSVAAAMIDEDNYKELAKE